VAHALGLHGHRHHAGAVEQLSGDAVGHLAVGIGLGDGRGQFGGAHPVQQPLAFERRQGRRNGAQADNGDDQKGEQQQSRRQTARPAQGKREPAPAGGRLGGTGRRRRGVCHG
jgi:hypothetical protein